MIMTTFIKVWAGYTEYDDNVVDDFYSIKGKFNKLQLSETVDYNFSYNLN